MKQITNYKKIQALLFLIVFFLITFSANIVPLSAKKDTKSDSPLNVTSDSMLVKKKASTVEFKGNVVVTRDDSIIHADNITMFFTQEAEKKTKKKKEIEKIVAKGNVKYFSGNRK